eukprot:1185476-Prorocentrum_minimum.AAC.4
MTSSPRVTCAVRVIFQCLTCTSSNLAQVPSDCGRTLLTVVWIAAPVALATRCMSPSSQRPAQNMLRSAKYWVARSPIGRRERMMLAPEATHASSCRHHKQTCTHTRSTKPVACLRWKILALIETKLHLGTASGAI